MRKKLPAEEPLAPKAETKAHALTDMEAVSVLQDRTGYTFNDPALAAKVFAVVTDFDTFTQPREKWRKRSQQDTKDLEREGDALINDVVATWIYRNFNEFSIERKERLQYNLQSNLFLSWCGMKLGLDEIEDVTRAGEILFGPLGKRTHALPLRAGVKETAKGVFIGTVAPTDEETAFRPYTRARNSAAEALSYVQMEFLRDNPWILWGFDGPSDLAPGRAYDYVHVASNFKQ